MTGICVGGDIPGDQDDALITFLLLRLTLMDFQGRGDPGSFSTRMP
jgi:hypothetical protein